MGAKSGIRISSKLKIRILGKSGSVAQLLHPLWIARNDVPSMGNILKAIDNELSALPEVKLMVSGGGLIEIYMNDYFSNKFWRAEETLKRLTNFVLGKVKFIAEALKNSARNYIIGVDVFDKHKTGGGQFAVVFSNGDIKTVAWKSYPVLDEANWLAGFGTSKGRQSPRIVSTVLGKTMVLVCHDAQAYNHRNKALVNRAQSITPRAQSIREMDKLMEDFKPKWVFNLIHQIEKPESLSTFRTSYKQIHEDYKHGPSVIGSFGYGQKIHKPEIPAESAQFPRNMARVRIILEAT